VDVRGRVGPDGRLVEPLHVLFDGGVAEGGARDGTQPLHQAAEEGVVRLELLHLWERVEREREGGRRVVVGGGSVARCACLSVSGTPTSLRVGVEVRVRVRVRDEGELHLLERLGYADVA
jgi:hypothetical protein